MRAASIISTSLAVIGLTSAAPAIVWRSGSTNNNSPTHISNAIDSRSLLASSIGGDEGNNDSSALAAVVFLVGRNADGSEGLTSLASKGKLPRVQEKYGDADEIHHHVRGVESSRTVATDARVGGEYAVEEVNMDEFRRKLSSMAQTEAIVEGEEKEASKSEQKRRLAISKADILVVNVNSKTDDATIIDEAIVSAIDSSAVKNVVLSSIRSTNEVKHARTLAVKARSGRSKQKAAANRRRLEDEGNNNNQNNQNQNQEDEAGVYYVKATPNIFAGILFFFMFVFTAHLGLTCMNMIEGQDVYVKKMPAIGREV